MTEKAYIYTFGCQMNEHDSQRMIEILAEIGYEMAENVADASLILINTCSVRKNPQNKVYSLLGQLRPLKKSNPALIIGVAGCVAQQEGEKLLYRDRAVNMVFGPDRYFHLPEMLESVRNGERVVLTDWLPHDRKVQNFIPEEWLEKGHVDGCKAYIAIMKGCNNFCSFCIVPYVRGREVSRDPENILREARHLIRKGAKEIWLLGQNVNSYRADEWDFYRLLDAVSQLEGLKRLRFTSPHPKDWNHALSDLMAARPALCNHLHLPFQAGSDRILALMNRRHTAQEFLDKVAYLKSVNPNVEVSTDLIVGFPTETEADFEQTLRILREVRFSQVYAFMYSPRPGTKAAELEDPVPKQVKHERLQRVLALYESINAEAMRAYLGTTLEALIEGPDPKKRDAMHGRTEGNRPITVKGTSLKVGDLVPVRITNVRAHSLEGEAALPASVGETQWR